MDAFHWIFRSCAKNQLDLLETPFTIRNNKDLYKFAKKHVPKSHESVTFDYNYKEIKEPEIETAEWDFKLVEKNSGLPIKTTKIGTSNTLHLLEAICSLKFEGEYLTSSTNYGHNNADKWEFD